MDSKFPLVQVAYRKEYWQILVLSEGDTRYTQRRGIELWLEKARFELEVGAREIFDIGKFHRRNLRRKLVAKESTLSITENADRAVIEALL